MIEILIFGAMLQLALRSHCTSEGGGLCHPAVCHPEISWVFLLSSQCCEQCRTLLVDIKVKYWSLLQTCCGEDLSQPQIHLHTENPPLGRPWQHRLQLAPGMGWLEFLLCYWISKISFGIRIEDKFSNWNKCVVQIWFLPAKVQGDFHCSWSDCAYIALMYF